MTFSVSRNHGLFEWAGDGLRAVFVQKRNLLNLTVWRMVWDVLRFNLFALDLLEERGPDGEISVGDYLKREGYGTGFREDYLLVGGILMPSTGAHQNSPFQSPNIS